MFTKTTYFAELLRGFMESQGDTLDEAFERLEAREPAHAVPYLERAYMLVLKTDALLN